MVIIGCPLREIVKRKTVTETITRYNEETGQPYQKEVERVIYTCNGQEIDLSDLDKGKDGYTDNLEEWLDSMGLTYLGIDRVWQKNHLEVLRVGVELSREARGINDSPLRGFPFAKAEAAKEKAKESLEKLGYFGELYLYVVNEE